MGTGWVNVWVFFSQYFLRKFHIFSFLLLLNCILNEGFRKPNFFTILLWTSHFLFMPPLATNWYKIIGV